MATHEHLRKHIVIVGAGFAGLAAALELEELRQATADSYNVTLVDKNCYHLYHALLYEVATAPEMVTEKDLAALRSGVCIRIKAFKDIFLKKEINVIQDAVMTINLADRRLELQSQPPVHFDYLILALGSVSNDFGIPGLKEHSVALKDLAGALEINLKLQQLFQRLAKSHQPVHMVIGGGGIAGVETAAELRNYVRQHGRRRGLDPALAEVHLVEAAPSILPGLDPWIQTAARRRLESLGVILHTGQPITRVGPNEATLKDGTTLPHDLFLWNGGVKAPAILAQLGQPLAGRGQIAVTRHMTLPDNDRISVIGDSAFILDAQSQRPVPQIASVAVAQGQLAADNIWHHIHGQPMKEYHPKTGSYVFPLGGRWAISTMAGLRLTGFAGWVARKITDLNYFLSIMTWRNAWRVLLTGGRIYLKND